MDKEGRHDYSVFNVILEGSGSEMADPRGRRFTPFKKDQEEEIVVTRLKIELPRITSDLTASNEESKL